MSHNNNNMVSLLVTAGNSECVLAMLEHLNMQSHIIVAVLIITATYLSYPGSAGTVYEGEIWST